MNNFHFYRDANYVASVAARLHNFFCARLLIYILSLSVRQLLGEKYIYITQNYRPTLLCIIHYKLSPRANFFFAKEF